MSRAKLFEIGGQWIGRVSGRDGYYAFRYDSKTQRVVRISLKTNDLEEAKQLLVKSVSTPVKYDPQHPNEVMLVLVFNHYFENHSDKKPSANAARRAAELVLTFLEMECGYEPDVKVGVFTKSLQAHYAIWASEKHSHSPAYISRCLSVVAAACHFAAKTIVKRLPNGVLTESRILNAMPEVCYDAKWLAELIDKPEPKPRDFVPSFEQLASLLDTPGSEVLRRYDIIALNTWARPEAILDLKINGQVDFDNSIVNLNPPGRKQTKKHRPAIRLTENLRGWLEHWGEDSPLSFNSRKVTKAGKPIRDSASHIKAQFKRRTFRWMLSQAGHGSDEIDELFKQARGGNKVPFQSALKATEQKGIQRITPYTYRHFMATKIRSLPEIKVDREQRSLWLGHGKRDTTSWYEKHDPEHLLECALATNMILKKLDGLTQRSLVPAAVDQEKPLKRVNQGG